MQTTTQPQTTNNSLGRDASVQIPKNHSIKEISMKKIVFMGKTIPVEVIESIEPGKKTGIIITDYLNDPVDRWIEPDAVKTIELVRARSVDLAKLLDSGEIDWRTLEDVF